MERGHSGRDKVSCWWWWWWWAMVYRLSPHEHALCTHSVRSCQTGMALAWFELWLIAQVQVEFTGGLWYHCQNEWQTQNRVMEYYQEAICNAGWAWISKGCCLPEMKSSITLTSYLIRSWVAFKDKEIFFSYCAHTVWWPKLQAAVWNLLNFALNIKSMVGDVSEVWKIFFRITSFTAGEFKVNNVSCLF